MTQTQGWLLILVLAGAAGWFIAKDVAEMPNATERAIDAHNAIMDRIRP